MTRPDQELEKKYKYSWIPYLILVVTSFLTYMLWDYAKNYYEYESRSLFNREIVDIQKHIETRMKNQEYTLHAALAYMCQSDYVDHEAWHDFLQILKTDDFFPGAQGIGYAIMLEPNKLQETEQILSKENNRPISIFPKGKRPIYSTVVHIDPHNKANEVTIGYDMFAEPVRHEAMQRARDTGEATISGRVTLLQELDNSNTQPGVLMYHPLYKENKPLDTPEQRRAALSGYVYSPFKMYDLMNGILQENELINFEIYDSTEPASKELLYRSFDSSDHTDACFSEVRPITIGGRTWELHFTTSSAFYDQSKRRELSIFLGLIIIFDLFLFTLLLYMVKSWQKSNQYSKELLAGQQLYETLSQCNKAIIHAKNEKELFFNICNEVVKYGAVRMAWIGVEDKESKTIQIVASGGKGREYLDSLKISTDPADPTSKGPTGMAFNQARSFWCQDFQHDKVTQLWHKRGEEFGWKASASIPLHIEEETIGIFSLYATKINAFDIEAQNLFEEMAANISYALGSFEANKARERAEQAIILEKETAQQYLDIVDVMILALDQDKRVTLINRKGCEIIGYPAHEVIGKNWIENFLPKSVRDTVNTVGEALLNNSNDPVKHFENPVLTKDGEERLISWRNTTLFDTEGNPIGILTSGEDITERRRMETLSSRLSQVVDQNPYPTIITDIDGIIEYANPMCIQLSGYSKDELVGKKMNLFNSGEHSKKFYQGLWRTIKEDKDIWNGMLMDKMKDGSIKDCQATIFPIFDAHGKLSNFVSITEDVTERNTKDRLFLMQTRQAQMGEMISMIAHQWRQPLTIINAIAGKIRLKEALKKDEDLEVVEALGKIEQQSLFLSNTITDFKDIFRPDKPKERIRLSTLIKNALNLLDHSIKSHNVNLQFILDHNTEVETFSNEVLQVVLTLVKNSLEAFSENHIKEPSITILTDQDETYATITIQDNAGGIKAEILEQIFMPYFTTKQMSNGTGLGLYMSKMVIEEHCEGKIEVKSDHKTMTTFIISLPREEIQS